MAIDGSKNAALFALQIMAVSNPSLNEKLVKYKKDMVDTVNHKDNKIQALAKEL